MSARTLYRKLPQSRRICNYYRCQKRLQRNPDFKGGRLYHHGCLMSALDERFRCLDCSRVFDATEAAFEERRRVRGDEFKEGLRVVCPNCGSRNLKAAGMPFVPQHHAMPSGAFVEVR